MVKVICSADMKEAGMQIQAAIDDAETRGASLLRIIHTLPKREGADIETLLLFRTPQTEE